MPKAVKKKSTSTKAKKTPVKKVAKPAAVASPSGAGGRSNFMWRLLKKKEAERQKMATEKTGNGSGFQNQGAVTSSRGFSRFAGPRRRAG